MLSCKTLNELKIYTEKIIRNKAQMSTEFTATSYTAYNILNSSDALHLNELAFLISLHFVEMFYKSSRDQKYPVQNE